jgi:hypothetical protein
MFRLVMQGCWANCLGDCGGGISREHYVSECVFPNQSIFVRGLDFCLDSPKKLRSESLTTKILCVDHNSRLGETVDWVAGNAFGALRSFTALRNQRSELPQLNWASREFDIDARGLEIWCLKTMLNFSFGRQTIIGPSPHAAGTIPDELVRIAFGLEEFTDGRGLYIAYRESETFTLEDRFHYTAKTRGPNLMMGYFALHGFRFYLNLEPTAKKYDRIEDSSVFYREAHFVDPIETVLGEPIDSLQSLIRAERARGSFRQKISIVWPKIASKAR